MCASTQSVSWNRGSASPSEGEPRVEVLLGLFEVAPVVEPAQLLAAVIVGRARQIVQRLAEKVHVAALPHRLGQELAHGPA